MPVVGIVMLAQGLAEFGSLLFNRRARSKEWEMAVASTMKNHVILVGLGHLGYRVALKLHEMGEQIAAIEFTNADTLNAVRNLVIPVIHDDTPTASRESDLHLACKDEMVAVLQKKFPSGSWSLERKDLNADTSKGYTKVEPDISGRIGNNKAVVIEVQASTLPINTILHRTEQYTKRGAFILWVVPLTEDLGTTTFRPRLFERFLHTIYYGRVYYWLRGYGTQLQPVHFGKAERYIEVSNWFEPDGSERAEGGYNKPYKRVKTPLYGDLVDLTEQFETHSRDPFELENDLLSVPSAKIFRDTLEPWW